MRLEDALKRIPKLLSEMTHIDFEEAETSPRVEGSGGNVYAPDLVINSSEHTFLVEFKNQGTAEHVGAGIRQLAHYREKVATNAIPLLAVPFMGNVGRRLCEEAAISWMDLSGNASIHADGLHVRIEGRPNQFARPGRPKNLFAAKASRVARVLLLDPSKPWSQQHLVEETGLTKGYVSKVVNRYLKAGLIARDEKGALFPEDPDLLLDSWADVYDIQQHDVVRAHITFRSSESGLRELSSRLREQGIRHAATALAAAWHYTKFASFRLITMYSAETPEPEILRDLGYRTTSSGANLWIIKPNDEGVFSGTVHSDDVPYVSSLQCYLDLKGHLERSAEAAEDLRRKCLNWRDHAGQ